MKGVILAGGTGSRLFPITKVTNKHLLPVGRKPMIYHAIEKMVDAGIRMILVVTGVDHMGDVVSALGSGSEFGCELTYRVQDEAGGIAQALGLAQNFVGDSKFAVILGDNIFESSLASYVDEFESQDGGAQVLLTEVSDPERFGVAELDGDRLVGIEEKPTHPKSNYAVTGVYFYDSSVFDYVAQLSPSQRGELEISDVNNFYVKEDRCRYAILPGWWTDAGTFESLAKANSLVAF